MALKRLKLKVAKNAEKSHFYTEKGHFGVIFRPFQNLIFSLHNSTYKSSKSKKRSVTLSRVSLAFEQA